AIGSARSPARLLILKGPTQSTRRTSPRRCSSGRCDKKLCRTAGWKGCCIDFLLLRRRPFSRVLPRLLLAIELIVVALIVRQWAYVTTYRLYLDHDIGGARQSTVTQQFELAGGRVVPRLVTRKNERLAVPNRIAAGTVV